MHIKSFAIKSRTIDVLGCQTSTKCAPKYLIEVDGILHFILRIIFTAQPSMPKIKKNRHHPIHFSNITVICIIFLSLKIRPCPLKNTSLYHNSKTKHCGINLISFIICIFLYHHVKKIKNDI